MDRGATHFTHWFQPQTGTTAEKHDAFLSLKSTFTAAGEEVIFVLYYLAGSLENTSKGVFSKNKDKRKQGTGSTSLDRRQKAKRRKSTLGKKNVLRQQQQRQLAAARNPTQHCDSNSNQRTTGHRQMASNGSICFTVSKRNKDKQTKI
jgi:hypothetical protein